MRRHCSTRAVWVFILRGRAIQFRAEYSTSIRYGDSADNCTTTSAPNYTQPGYYTVYYKINYSYSGETMTENGASYVWLVNNDD